jgi:hypothetical protein
MNEKPLTPAELEALEMRNALREIEHEPFAVPIPAKDLPEPKPPAYRTEKERKFGIVLASVSAREALNNLQALASSGDKEARDSLLELLCSAVGKLETFTYQHPELAREKARVLPLWPVCVSLHPLVMKDTRALLKRLEVGTASEIRHSAGARWGIGWGGVVSTATVWAGAIVETIRRNRTRMESVKRCYQQLRKRWPKETAAKWRKIPQWAKKCRTLPPLSKATAPQWFEIGWQVILEHTNGKPEDVPELAALVESTRAGKYACRYAKTAGRVRSAEILHRKESRKRTADADARDRIKGRIFDALHNMARGFPQ